MTDQPVPDRGDDLTPSKIGGEDAPLATGNGDPATSDATPSTEDDGRPDETAGSGDAPRPSPDI